MHGGKPSNLPEGTLRAMSADSMGQGTDEPVGNPVSRPAAVNGTSTGYQQIARYGDDAPWTNVLWTIVGILCACSLAVLLFMQ
jgi:hypothetical protein